MWPIDYNVFHTIGSVHLGFAENFWVMHTQLTESIVGGCRWDYKAGNYSPQVLALADSDLDAVETVIPYPYSTVEIEKTRTFLQISSQFFQSQL
jgi:hypothetical protein